MKINIYQTISAVIIIVLVGIYAFKCEQDRDGLLKQERAIPIKPFYIIDKESVGTEYVIYCIDAKGHRFSFDVEFTNEGTFQVGDTIK